MPEATTYYLDTTTIEYKNAEEHYLAEQTKRIEQIGTYWDYYDGLHKKHLANQRDGHDDNVILNHVSVVAEKLAAFLVGDGVTFDAGSDDERTDTDDAIEELWQMNRGEILQNDLALAGAVEGHCAVLMTPPADMDRDGNRVMTEGLPTLTRLKQKHFTAFWDAFDMRRVLWYRLQSGSLRRDYVRGVIAEGDRSFEDFDNAPAWSVVEWRADKERMNKTAMVGNVNTQWRLRSITPWLFPWPPIVDWQNSPASNSYYGKTDIAAAIPLNDTLNFVISNLNRIVKHYADPKTIGTGFKAESLVASAVGGFYTVDNPEAKIYNLEMQSDGSLARWLAEIVNGGLWQSAGVVDPQTMKDRVGALTNFGLRVLFTDAIKKTDKKRLLYGEAFEMINKYGLEMAGREVPKKITTIWPDVLPTDERAEVETLGMDLDRKAISMETYRDRRGYDNEREEDRIAEETETSANPLAGLLAGQGFNNRAFNAGR